MKLSVILLVSFVVASSNQEPVNRRFMRQAPERGNGKIGKIHNQRFKNGALTTTARPTVIVTEASNTTLPRRTAEEIRQEYPWIEEPESTAEGAKLPGDGRRRLGGPDDIRRKLNLHNSNSMRIRYGTKGPNGKYRIRLEQRWRGVRVYEGHVLAEQENTGLILDDTVDGQFVQGIDDDLTSATPTISSANALQIAKRTHRHSNIDDSVLENVSTELIIIVRDGVAKLCYRVIYFIQGDSSKKRNGNNNNSNNGKARGRNLTPGGRQTDLPPVVEETNGEDDVRLSATDNSTRPYTILDANTGEVYESWDGLASMSRTVKPLVMGNSKTGKVTNWVPVYYSGNNCYYRHPLGNNQYMDLNDKGLSGYGSFTCSDGQLTTYDAGISGSYSPRNSAFYYAMQVLNFLKIKTNRSIQRAIQVEVHHYADTAQWTGSALQFGDGNSVFYPLTEPDVVAHEVGHIFTEETSDLHLNSQAGAINEAFSDMTGVAFLQFKFTTVTYKFGDRVIKGGSYALRDMCNPSAGTTPTISHTSAWTYSTSIHTGSGIFSKAFCELSKKSNWSMELAYQVFADANVNYWTQTSTFTAAACGVKKATIDLRGGFESDVVDSFSVVGVYISTCY